MSRGLAGRGSRSYRQNSGVCAAVSTGYRKRRNHPFDSFQGFVRAPDQRRVLREQPFPGSLKTVSIHWAPQEGMQVRASGARLGFWNVRPRIPPASLSASAFRGRLPVVHHRRCQAVLFGVLHQMPSWPPTSLQRLHAAHSAPLLNTTDRAGMERSGWSRGSIILTEGQRGGAERRPTRHIFHTWAIRPCSVWYRVPLLSANCREGRDVSRSVARWQVSPRGLRVSFGATSAGRVLTVRLT